jgi:hypothetical protein
MRTKQQTALLWSALINSTSELCCSSIRIYTFSEPSSLYKHQEMRVWCQEHTFIYLSFLAQPPWSIDTDK